MFGQHTFKIHAGDFGPGEGTFSSLTDAFTLPIKGKLIATECRSANQISDVQIATEESVKKLGGTLGWGLAGGAILGPVGLLAGLLAGGRSKKIVFIAKFSDGRKFLASSDSQVFTAIQSATFGSH